MATESRILRTKIKGRLLLNDGQRCRLAEIGRRLGRKALSEIATIVKPDAILGWHRELIARKAYVSRTPQHLKDRYWGVTGSGDANPSLCGSFDYDYPERQS